MKTKLIIAAIIAAFSTFAQTPSAIVIDIKVTGELTKGDKDTIKYIIDIANANSVLDDVSAPLLPKTNADLKSSLETILIRQNRSYITNAAAAAELVVEQKLTPEARHVMMRAIIEKLNAGKTPEQIESAIKAIP